MEVCLAFCQSKIQKFQFSIVLVSCCQALGTRRSRQSVTRLFGLVQYLHLVPYEVSFFHAEQKPANEGTLKEYSNYIYRFVFVFLKDIKCWFMNNNATRLGL